VPGERVRVAVRGYGNAVLELPATGEIELPFDRFTLEGQTQARYFEHDLAVKKQQEKREKVQFFSPGGGRVNEPFEGHHTELPKGWRTVPAQAARPAIKRPPRAPRRPPDDDPFRSFEPRRGLGLVGPVAPVQLERAPELRIENGEYRIEGVDVRVRPHMEGDRVTGLEMRALETVRNGYITTGGWTRSARFAPGGGQFFSPDDAIDRGPGVFRLWTVLASDPRVPPTLRQLVADSIERFLREGIPESCSAPAMRDPIAAMARAVGVAGDQIQLLYFGAGA
jgi:hypothetical protein